jgi:hypothetical protein
MKKSNDKFEWTEEADAAFAQLKKVLSTPPVLVAPKEKEPLLLYIAATHQVVSTVLVVERSEEEKSPWRPEASIFHQQSVVSNKTKVPALSEVGIQCLHNRMKTTIVLCGAPNYSGQRGSIVEHIE